MTATRLAVFEGLFVTARVVMTQSALEGLVAHALAGTADFLTVERLDWEEDGLGVVAIGAQVLERVGIDKGHAIFVRAGGPDASFVSENGSR